MKKLLFVVNNPSFFLSHRLPLGIAAAARGYEVHVATPPGPSSAEIVRHRFGFHPVPMERNSGKPWEELVTLLALRRLYQALRPDLVHHVTIKPVLYGGLVARAIGVPAVVSAVSGLGTVFLARGKRAQLKRRAIVLAYRAALRHPNGRVIFQNVDDMAAFVDAGAVEPSNAVLIRGSGVDLAEFTPGAEPPPEPVTVLLPARMLWDKGVGEFVEAARMLRSSGIRFVLVGPVDAGNLTSITAAELMAWQNEGLLTWLGNRCDMPALLRTAHVVCLPSYREGLPKALIEAAACGRPIITTDVPGCRDVVRDGENGLLVPARDARGLADAIGKLANDAALRARMGARSREIAEREFSVTAVAEETLAVYAALLSIDSITPREPPRPGPSGAAASP